MSCGSLVFVDEEEQTVHLVHPSVKQFLLGEITEASSFERWHFTAEEAHRRMYETAITYLCAIGERALMKPTVSETSQLSPKIGLSAAAADTIALSISKSNQGLSTGLVKTVTMLSKNQVPSAI